ncbi:MAG: sigma-70 domain-containing protein [Halobacteriota archaeon]|nr:sigma-70 domain-containing protein [Halobacteriota archaeon]
MTEQQMIMEWQRTGDPQLLEDILKKVEPIIVTSIMKWGGLLPRPALLAKGKSIAVDALKDYNPSKGKLSTYLYSRLQKVSRDVYSIQNAIKIPENRAVHVGLYNRAFNKLSSQFGREPTVAELSDELTLPVEEIRRLHNEVRRELTAASDMDIYGEIGMVSDPNAQMAIDYTYMNLPDQEKLLFESLTGYGGKLVMKPGEAAQKYGMSSSQVSKFKSRIADQIQGSM